MVLWFGDLACADRPNRADGRQLVDQFRAILAPPPVVVVPAPVVMPAAAPPDVDALLQSLEDRTVALTQSVRDVRQAIRAGVAVA